MSPRSALVRRSAAALAVTGTLILTGGALGVAPAQAADATHATLAGTVTDGSTTNPAAGVNVSIQHTDGSAVTSTTTGANGAWSADVAPGTYDVLFTADQFLPKYYDGTDVSRPATGTTVAADSTTTMDASLTEGVFLAGKVTEATSGAAVSGVPVQVDYYHATSTGGGWEEVPTYLDHTTHTTANDGTWYAEVPRGSYIVHFSPSAYASQYWSSSSPTGVQAPGQATALSAYNTSVNTQLTKTGATGGTVFAPDGKTPVNGATAQLLSVYNDSSGVQHTQVIKSATTGSDGTWSMSGVAPGSYDLAVTTSGYTTTYYKNTASLSQATPITIASGQTTPSEDVTLIAQGSVLSGTITAANGGSAAAGTVTAYQLVTKSTVPHTEWDPVTSVSSSDGTYSLSVGPGTYRVKYDPTAGPYPGIPTYYPSAPGIDTAADVTVTATSPAHANIVQPGTGTIQGVVTMDGTPQAQASVKACTPEVYDVRDGVDQVNCNFAPTNPNVTGVDGSYSISVPAGTWYVEATSKDLAKSAFHVSAGSEPSDELRDAAPVSVSVGSGTSGADVELDVKDVSTLTQVTDRVKPTISGSLGVGSTLTADPGVWLPSGASYAYQWQSNGNAISGATSQTYAPTAGQIGQSISVQVTASEGALTPGVATSAQTDSVPLLFGGASSPTNSAAPAISGTPQVGHRLTASTGTWSSSGSFQYQWYATSGTSTTAIPWANSSSYTPTTDVATDTLSVKVWDTVSGLSGSATSAKTAAVAPAPIQNLTVPTITGTAAIGQTLSASSGTWSPTPTTYAYQWYDDGTAISGATAPNYTVVAADKGKHVTVGVTASRTGYQDAKATSAPTAAVTDSTTTQPAVQNVVAPRIKGTATVGRTLTATSGSWSPSTAQLSYQWLANGAAIRGAAGSTYKVTKSNIGKQISVRVTAAAPSMTPATARSGSTRPVPRFRPRLRISLSKFVHHSEIVVVRASEAGGTVTGHIRVAVDSTVKTVRLRDGQARLVFHNLRRGGHRARVILRATQRQTAASASRHFISH